jgi:GxxExxY protein
LQNPQRSSDSPTCFEESELVRRLQWPGAVALYSTPLARRVIGSAIEVHRQLGPGLLESTYDRCFAQELTLAGLEFLRETPLPVVYKGIEVDWGYRIDYLIENELLVELKAVETLLPVHKAQAVTYLKLLGLRQALLFNFNVVRMKDGIKSILLPRDG